MSLIEEEKKFPAQKLLLIGIPVFIFAVAISILSHQYAHIIVNKTICGAENSHGINIVRTVDLHSEQGMCAIASFAGPLWTFLLAIVSFSLFIRHPSNLFLASMAFVNASTRIPETVTVFLQLLFHNKAKLVVDESSSLTLLHLHDPTIPVLILFFFSLITIFLTITVVHDTKMVPWKWLVALALFLSIVPIENLVWNLFAPIIS